MRLCLLIALLLVFNSYGFCEKLEISSKWKQSIDTRSAIIPYGLGRIIDNTGKIDFGIHQKGYVDFYGLLRKSVRDVNFFDKMSSNKLSLIYKIESFSADKRGSIIQVDVGVRYQLVDNNGDILFEQLIHSTGNSDAYSDDYLRAWRANAQKFMILLRTRWDVDFAPTGNQLWQAAEQEALNPNRGIDSYLTIGIGSAFSAGKSVVGGAVDVLADPTFSAAIQQQTASMQRELDRQRRQEIEAKAYSARMAEERRRTTPSPSHTSSATSSYGSSSSSSSYSASSSSKSSGSSSSGSLDGNSNIGATNKKYQTEREKNLKAQEQKKLEQQKAYEVKLAKEQREREEEEKQREIQLTNEKREKERQAEKERKEREQLAQKQREEQERNNYLTNVKNSLRLKAVNCYGNNYAVGQIPKGLGLSKHGGINVHYRASCPGGGRYNGISKNFIGMMAGCFGDTNSHDGGLIPKEVLSCKAEDMTVDVTNVTFTR